MKANQLLTKAEELEALLAETIDSQLPEIDESFFVAAPPTPSPEAVAAEDNATLLPELIRSIIEYALNRAPSTATAAHIGEAISDGVLTAVEQLKLDDRKVSEAVDDFLDELCLTVRNNLSGE